MTLERYLHDQNLTLRQFAVLIGVANAGVVSKYVNGGRMPRPGIMHRISEVTGGAVQPNDFYADAAE